MGDVSQRLSGPSPCDGGRRQAAWAKVLPARLPVIRPPAPPTFDSTDPRKPVMGVSPLDYPESQRGSLSSNIPLKSQVLFSLLPFLMTEKMFIEMET